MLTTRQFLKNIVIVGSAFFLPPLKSNNSEEFLKSFVKHYDFRAEGRFTHEYHPYLLNKTIESLKQLSDRLEQENLSLRGHIIISGYEGEAIPSYYTNYQKAKINDEMSSKNKEGSSLRLHNRFGLMTGYLFKDGNEYAKRWLEKDDLSFMHINPRSVELFRDEMEIFQKHAFEGSYSFMNEVADRVIRHFKEKDFKTLLSTLIDFWQKLYDSEVTLAGNQSAATQDILFSVEYAKYLRNSCVPFLGYYVGGDITYPIETSVKQGKEATRNAQDFVKTFVPTLKSVADEKTVYVFCSFVDGVGKSTMLGNIKNWMRFGNDISKYERVDNSSSQYAELFEFKDKVYVADLPAQVSHFTYKPDGLVYVDAATELSLKALEEVRAWVREKKHSLVNAYYKIRKEVMDTWQKEGPFAPSLCDPKEPERAFLKNIILLKRESSLWIPFSKDGKHFVFEWDDLLINNVRLLRPLSGAASHGLKNIESEQMLFFDGIRFPLSYEVFLQDLINKLKAQDIKNIVFVNFTSMYPRSCRENIRINYLIQQMAHLDPDFDVDASLYKKFVNASELYANVINKNSAPLIETAFGLEAFTRCILYEILEQQQRTNLDGLSLEQLTLKINSVGMELSNEDFMKTIHSLINAKFSHEVKELERRFALTKEYINIQQFSFSDLEHFSELLVDFFGQDEGNQSRAQLWAGLASPLVIPDGDEQLNGFKNKPFMLENKTAVVARYEFEPLCRDASLISWFMKTLRANWYAQCANILYEKERYAVIPMIAKFSAKTGQVYILQKQLPIYEGEEPKHSLRLFHIPRKVRWGEFKGKPYCLEWENSETNTEIFAFGADVVKNKYRKASCAVNKALSAYKEEYGAQSVLPTAQLLETLKADSTWQEESDQLLNKARQNGKFKGEIIDEEESSSFASPGVKCYLGGTEYKEAARFLVRMLATIEMIIKDQESDIVVRRGSKKDFRAALQLFEKITLPRYYGIMFEEPLFDDYKTVEPLLAWEMLK